MFGSHHRPVVATAALLGLVLAPAAPVCAAPVQADAQVGSLDVSGAEALIRQEHYDEAEKQLLLIEKQHRGDSQVEFLLGMSYLGKRDYHRAIRYFRAILTREPGALRVRLELARAYYLARDFDRSESEFRKTVSGPLPPQAVANVQRFLSAIAQERRWTSSVSVGVAPSTNANSGTEATTVGIYGLPFDLSPDARRQSGVGLNLALSTEWTPPVTRSLQMVVGVQAFGTGYTQTARYNDYTAVAYAGPRYFSNRWSIGLSGSVFRRWYGNRSYNSGVGGKLSGGYMVNPWLIMRGGFGIQQVRYVSVGEQDGNVYSGELSVLVNIDPQTRIEATGRRIRQTSRLSAYSNRLTEASVTVQHDFPRGYVATVQADAAGIDYDAALPAFGVARSDSHWFAKVALFNRGVRIWGFSPQLSLTHTTHGANIGLYRYKKDEAEVSFVRSF